MKNLLFLDDFRTPKLVPLYDFLTSTQAPFNKEELWDVVTNYQEFVVYIEAYYILNNSLPELISFDHDLSDEHYSSDMFTNPENYNDKYDTFNEKTGYECAKWLVDFCMDNNITLPKYLCHSQNPVGKENIIKYLDNFNIFQEKNK